MKDFLYKRGFLIAAFFLASLALSWWFSHNERDGLARGLMLDTAMYDSIEVFLPLDSTEAALPTGVSLEQYCPRPRNQGEQNSCVAWSVAYAAQTIILAQATQSNPNSIAFSPSFLFNQVALNRCEGAYIHTALDKMRQTGLVPFSDFPYNDNICDRKPTGELLTAAKRFRIAGYSRLTKSKSDYTVDTAAIKQCLAQGMPVVIGALVTESFEDLTEKVWHRDPNEPVVGGHAMCVVGYNDAVEGGAFRILNSWGEDWGDKGFVWVRYDDFLPFCKEAYTIEPLPLQQHFEVEMSMMDSNFGKMALSKKAAVFVPETQNTTGETNAPAYLKIKNKTKQYFYLLTQKEGGTASVIFPKNHSESPYLGLCGKRTFLLPNLENDTKTGAQTGMNSVVAVYSKTPLAIDSLCAQINALRNGTLNSNLQKMLQKQIDPTATMEMSKNNIMLKANEAEYSVVIVPFVLPIVFRSSIPTFQDALKNPIDSLVLRCANIKTTAKTISFDLLARTSRHTAWNGFFNQIELGVEYDPTLIAATVAQEATQSLAPDLIKANYQLIVDYQKNKLVVKINPKAADRVFFSQKERLLARLTLPIGLCKGKNTFLRLSPNAQNSVASYSLTNTVPAKGALTLSYKHTHLIDATVPLKCKY